MRYSLILCLGILLFHAPLWSQSDGNDHGQITLHVGTIAIYHTFSLGYESPDFLASSEKHALVGRVGFGGWQTSLFRANTGFQSHFELSYLRGSGKHHLEIGSGLVFHFDKGLKGQTMAYIGSLYRPFLGYRYQDPNQRLSFRIGTGWREVLQIGMGFRL